ncbi:glycosyltransferase family 2 protein [Pelagibacterales bacterium SAG-MED15]|nr:glycosyltransferase family 2 protein [Pelagibacterales bacterium SAG-MED15]
MKVKILIPIYNDWNSVKRLVDNIDKVINDIDCDFSIIIVNDASTQKKPENCFNFKNLKSIKIINMLENRGHGRCNAAGLKYIYENEDFDYVLPMDGDGEDRPEEIIQFVEKIKTDPEIPVVGERIKRSESNLFKFCYVVHKILTFIFTGKSIKFGHFSCIPKSIVKEMVNEKATWNCYSASLVKITKERNSIPSIRGKRYFDLSKMSFYNLIIHSFSIISVFKYNVLIRSVFYLFIYLFLIYPKLSFITFLPFIFITIFTSLIFILSKRENLDEYNNCLENVGNIEVVK